MVNLLLNFQPIHVCITGYLLINHLVFAAYIITIIIPFSQQEYVNFQIKQTLKNSDSAQACVYSIWQMLPLFSNTFSMSGRFADLHTFRLKILAT